MKRVRFTRSAERDLESIADYISHDNPRRAFTFVRELRNRCNALGEFPGLARGLPALGDDAHILVYKSYLILYRDLTDHVAILRVIHGARDLAVILEDWDDPE